MLSPSELQLIHSNPSLLRNFCILSHVDHGKSTLADSLLSSNAVISASAAGLMRYLDNRPDEQERGITMKSSAHALACVHESKPYGLMLVDTPGHVDFSNEVFAASSMADGALILVDAVEGLCAQTYAVLRIAFQSELTPILVINKIDRLVVELRESPQDAYLRLRNLIEQVNAAAASMVSESAFARISSLLAKKGVEDISEEDLVIDFDCLDVDGAPYIFHPLNGNVIFSSAIDRFAFTPFDFINLYHEKMGISRAVLKKVLWGDYFFTSNGKSITTKAPTSTSPSVFAKCVLEPIWKLYKYICLETLFNTERVNFILNMLNLKINSKEVFNHNDRRAGVKAVLSRWLPLAPCVFKAVILHVPSPLSCTLTRLKCLAPDADVDSVISSVSSSSPLLASISKVFIVGRDIPSSHIEGDVIDASDYPFLAICRIWTGSLKVGQEVFVRQPKGDAVEKCRVQGLYLPLGSRFTPVSCANLGAVVAVRGCEGAFFKGGTLVDESIANQLSLKTVFDKTPVIKVEVSPVDLSKSTLFRKALNWLDQSDPACEVGLLRTGGHFIACSGELHVSQCLDDLKRWTGCELRVSLPLFSLRETLAVERPQAAEQVEVTLPGCKVFVRAFAIPFSCSQWLSTNTSLVKKAVNGCSESIQLIRTELSQASPRLKKLVEKNSVWAFGPRNYGPCLLINQAESLLKSFCYKSVLTACLNQSAGADSEHDDLFASLIPSITTAFQLFCNSGPLCEEPLMGVCLSIDKIELNGFDLESKSVAPISALREGFKTAFATSQPRLVEALLRCDVSTKQCALASVYAILGKRRAKVFGEDVREGTDSFIISAHLPLSESHGFIDELRSAASGQASAQLSFSHWELMDDNPLHVATEEEIEEYGDKGNIAPNIARNSMNVLKRRKGLVVKDDLLIVEAEKQRTLKR
ncbi:hypothetical protein RCL1_003430 [Eukaryota sp. TZLM3-RCL]